MLEAAGKAYEKVQSIKGLPEAFAEVALRVPLARKILSDVEARAPQTTEEAQKAIFPVVKSCEANAEILMTTLERLDPGESKSAWNLHVDRYISLIKSHGRKGRVEDLMKRILQDIYILASHKAINAASSEQLESLKEAIEKVGKVQKSVPDELFEDGAKVSISHGGHGTMVNQVGDRNEAWTHFGSGHINNIGGDAHFGSTSEDRRRKVLRRLNPSSYEKHKNRNPEAVPNTCVWFTEHVTFQEWLHYDTSSLLWVTADPGCGKSVLARHLVDKILPSLSQAHRVIYFFFKDDFEDQKRLAHALRCLLHQLLRDDSPLFTDSVLKALEELGENRSNTFDDLWAIFIAAFNYAKSFRTICVLDALDECDPSEYPSLIRALGCFHGNHDMGLRFLLTGRSYTYIQRSFQSLEDKVPTTRLRGEDETEVSRISEEIDLVIRSKVESLRKHWRLDTAEGELLCQQLTRTSSRTYLWVRLVFDMLDTVEPVARRSLRDSIDHVPGTVDEAYNKILRRSSDKARAKMLLHMVVSAMRPLYVDELATSFAILSRRSFGESESSVQSPDVFRQTMRNLCGLFVVTIHDQVYLIHQTAKEFLLRRDMNSCTATLTNNASLEWKFCLWPDESNRIMAEVCVRYLIFLGDHRPMHFRITKRALQEYSKDNALFDYAAKYWTSHCKTLNVVKNSEMIGLLKALCDTTWVGCQAWCRHALGVTASPYDRVKTKHPKALNNPKDRILMRNPSNFPDFEDIDSLAVASYFGVHHVVRELIAEGEVDLNARNGFSQRTALSWAAEAGHIDVVRSFLSTRTMFSIPFLLPRGIQVDLSDEDHRTPLSHAARHGHDKVVKALLSEGGARPNTPDIFGRTPLSYAAENGHVTVVRTLLTTGEDDIGAECDYGGRTPLSYAAGMGRLDVVDLLMNTGLFDQNSRCMMSKTPLAYASEHNHPLIVERLLRSGHADLEMSGKRLSRKCPLFLALEHKSPEIVLRLLDAGNVPVNATWKTMMKQRSTLLEIAAEFGNSGLIKALLAKSGNTCVFSKPQLLDALVVAIMSSERDAARLLLNVREVDLSLETMRDLIARLDAYRKYHVWQEDRWRITRILDEHRKSIPDSSRSLHDLESMILKSLDSLRLGRDISLSPISDF